MLTAATRKEIRQLADTKHRRALQRFVAEGTKCVLDTMAGFEPVLVVATGAWLDEFGTQLPASAEVIRVSPAEMDRLSLLKSATPVLAVFSIPAEEFDFAELNDSLTVALDRIQDPGNLGTIIRVADWMGVRNILASHDTVDVYNPKVIQATMGSLARVRVHYTSLDEALAEGTKRGIQVFGTFLDKDAANIYTAALPSQAILVMGNEGNGISSNVRSHIRHTLYIPPYPPDSQTAESLNVAVATAIALSQFRSRTN